MEVTERKIGGIIGPRHQPSQAVILSGSGTAALEVLT